MLQALLLAVAGAAVTAACGSSSTTSTGPSPTKCQVSLDVSPKSVAAGGTRGTVSVTTQPECAWTAASQAAWMSDLVPTSGQGTGQFTFQVPANPSAVARQGEIDVNGTRVSVSQEAAACAFALTPTTLSVNAGGSNDSAVAVATTTGCAWTATSGVPWITITAGATGTGNGSVGFRIDANAGGQRTGTLTIAGQPFTVTQSAVGCAYTIAPISQSIGAAGGAGSPITVTTTAACTWTAVSGVPWITVTSGATGTGSGSVGFTIAANTGAERTGTLTIGSQTFTVTQAAAVVAPACAYTIGSSAQSFPAAGGAGTAIAVTTTAGCAWTAVSGAPWITVTSGASGSGSGSVGFSVGANTGAARNGTITIAGQTFTVTQAAVAVTCTYSINPNSQSIAAAGGNGTTVTVTTPAGCAWGAVSGADWITVAPPSVPSGNGTVGFTVAVNTGAQRTGTITIAGQTFTVTQAAGAAPCAYNINPSSQSFAAAGGNGTAAVTTTAQCGWTANSNAAWINVTSGTPGTGNGTVGFNVLANGTGAERTGTLTIATRTFTVTQAAPVVTCNYAINPNNQSIAAAGGPGTTAVTTAAGCTWNSTSNAPFITLTSGASGSGNGSVGFTSAANTGPQRTGTLTIAGQTFTVTQANGCVYNINPTNQSFATAGGNGTVAVTTTTGCAWTAASNTSNPAWLTVTSGATGNGNGTVGFGVAINLLTPRTGTLTIAGRTFTVTQTGLLP